MTQGKKCIKCSIVYNLSEYKIYKHGYRNQCKLCEIEYQKQYREKNKEKIKELIITWQNNNPEKRKKQQKKYRKNNLEKRNEYQKKYRNSNKYITIWRDILHTMLRRLGKQKEGKTIDLLGYSAIELKNHIGSLFTDGMSWDNHGEWHVDHIKGVVNFDKDTHPSIVNALNNLRPLWATTREINGVIYEGNLNRKRN